VTSTPAKALLAGHTIAFRTDASMAIGTGHVMRCLTLADALAEQGACCCFIGRLHAGHLVELVRSRRHTVLALPLGSAPDGDTTPEPTQPPLTHASWLGSDQHADARATLAVLAGAGADWLVVDHYALSATWEHALRPACRRLLVIDDLADRDHDCELLVDQNLGRSAADYAGRVQPNARVLAGPRYALLRPQFAARREASLTRRRTSAGPVRRLLISLGGIDLDNATGAVLKALCNAPAVLPADCAITVVMGVRAPRLHDVHALAAQLPWPTDVRVAVDDMAELMADCDLAIGAAGGTAWERCCLGLPTLLLVLADNQRDGARSLDDAGAGLMLDPRQPLEQSLAPALVYLSGGDALAGMSRAASQICDGGGVRRVLEAMLDPSEMTGDE
jgi:UDP-2,4-diacetamido-2,4,6-trideoxy-beta-L-altropyranose hydrolase